MSRRGRVITGAAVVIGLLAVGLGSGLLKPGTRTRSASTGPAPVGASQSRWERLRAAPTPPPSGELSIRGLVRDERGPVANVRVSATRPMPGETLSEFPCPEDPAGGSDTRRGARRLPECLDEANAQVLELMGARLGEEPIYAETVTASDGSFVLEGLPAGVFTLWALNERGVELRPEVAAGTDGVELVLSEGRMMEGFVTDASDRPLADARVTLLHLGHPRFFDARSGKDGRFRVGPLPRGEYGLFAEKEGWLPEFLSPQLLELVRGTVVLVQPGWLVGRVLWEGEPAPGAEVRLRSESGVDQTGVTDKEGRFAFEELKPIVYGLTATRNGQYAAARTELSLPGVSTEEIVLRLGSAIYVEGTVRDDAQRPIGGAQVSLWRELNYARVWNASTNTEGHYRLGPMQVGTYNFHVAAPRYSDLMREARSVARDSGPMDFTLTHAVSIAGKIMDEEGNPVPDVSIVLILPNGGGRVIGDESRTRSDDNGEFLMDVASPGSWSLAIVDERFLPASLPVQAPAENLRWVLHRGAVVTGGVTDARGVPLEAVRVTLWRSQGSSGDPCDSARSGATDERGRFSLHGLEAGSYTVEASLVRNGVERQASLPVELRGREHAEVALRFDAGWDLAGLVEDEAGQPQAGVLIKAIASLGAAPGARRFCGSEGSQPLRTGPDGRFELSNLTADTYELWALKDEDRSLPVRAMGGEVTQDKSVRVRRGAKEVRLVFKRLARVMGRLVGPDGAPIPRFEVNERFMDDADGVFSWGFPSSGTLGLEFKAPGMAPRVLSLEVHAGVDVELGEVRMDPGRRVEGRVLDADTGAPIIEAVVLLIDQPEDLAAAPLVAETREDGAFELSHVAARPFVLEARHPGYRVKRVTLGTGSESVTLRLDHGAQVEVSVRDHQGQPLDAQVKLHGEDNSLWEEVDVRGGQGTRRGIEPGPYLVQVRATDDPKRVFLPQRVTIPESGRVALTFTERREGATLALRVETEKELTEVILLPGLMSLPFTTQQVSNWGDIGLMPEEEQEVMTFHALPPGRARLLLISSGEEGWFHLEELDIPAGGRLERVVHPNWQPIPDR